MLVCCPITNRVKGYPFEVVIDGNPDISGAVLSDQIKSLDWHARQAKFKGRVDNAIIRETQRKIKAT